MKQTDLDAIAAIHRELFHLRLLEIPRPPPAVELCDRLATLLHAHPVDRLASGLERKLQGAYLRLNLELALQLLARTDDGRSNWAKLALASLDPNGFVRQAALALLEKKGAPDALRFVLFRTGDWVPQVREVAMRAFRGALPQAPPATLIACVPVVVQMALKPGHPFAPDSKEHGPTAQLLMERLRTLADAEVMGALERGAAESWAIEELARRRSPRLPEAVRHALSSAARMVRMAAVRAIRRCAESEQAALVSLALRDALGLVRAEALAVADGRAIGDEVLTRCALDAHAGVRTQAQAALKRLRGADAVAALYRARISSPHAADRALALTGLAEVGEPDDAAEAVLRLDDASAKVRLAALRFLVRRSREDAHAAAQVALSDTSPKVFKLAVSLCAQRPFPALAQIVPALLRASTGDARRDLLHQRAGLRLLGALEVQARLPLLLEMLRDAVDETRALRLLEQAVRVLQPRQALPRALLDEAIAAVERFSFDKLSWSSTQARQRRKQDLLASLRLALRFAAPPG